MVVLVKPPLGATGKITEPTQVTPDCPGVTRLPATLFVSYPRGDPPKFVGLGEAVLDEIRLSSEIAGELSQVGDVQGFDVRQTRLRAAA